MISKLMDVDARMPNAVRMKSYTVNVNTLR